MTETEMVEVLHVRNDLCFNIKNIFSNSIEQAFSKFSYQKLNLLQLYYFTDLQMQMIFSIHFQTISTKLTTKLMRFIFSRRPRGAMVPPLQFPNQKMSKSFSFKHQGYCFIRMFRNYMNQKFHNFYRQCYNFWTIYGGFSFFLIT